VRCLRLRSPDMGLRHGSLVPRLPEPAQGLPGAAFFGAESGLVGPFHQFIGVEPLAAEGVTN
jgi:hypothetical protein